MDKALCPSLSIYSQLSPPNVSRKVNIPNINIIIMIFLNMLNVPKTLVIIKLNTKKISTDNNKYITILVAEILISIVFLIS